MRRLKHDGSVYFRAPSTVIEQAEGVARQRGMSFSEFLRQALRHEIRRAA
ncbi:hypothetical protein [Rhizorhabdus sp.]|jgi:predicted DNA binding CopG/RHH family protein|nr:hypothetical protein [Rhizorhabdus sp.]MBD3761482.1 ribbon-helix-helix protein, CopG family [Rhizorhabdus sp.]